MIRTKKNATRVTPPSPYFRETSQRALLQTVFSTRGAAMQRLRSRPR